MMEDRQSSLKKQNSGQAQSSRKEQTGRQEQARETKEALRVLGRVIRYMAANYKLAVTAVLACIIVSAGATLKGMVFIQSLVDDYIRPLAQQASTGNTAPDFSPLAGALCRMAVLYLIGILAAYAYNRIMVTVSQGTMKRLRVELFTRMESLPIRYFDTHAHGDIMSVYTNDVDTLRQLMSQSVPQVANSAVTLAATAVSMLILNIPLSILTFAMACVMLFATKCLSGKSASHFGKQQNSLGEVDGYIEEMMDGQKVVKVFCHEEQAKQDFEVLNERLRDNADKANRYANLLMPVNANIGNLSYVLCAVTGGILALNGIGGITIGTIIAFVGLNKNFTQPITQISQQMNSVVMAAAGAARVFELLDEKPEEDQGYVEFVNVREQEDGTLEETKERTGVWAWKHPHKAEGTVTYKKMEGGIVFDGVDFGYDQSKMVLHDIKMFAEPGQKIAFVGSTGAGKTTMVNLLMRFFEINSGNIKIDGVPTSEMTREGVHDLFSMVLQDTWLFEGTVRENLVYNKTGVTDQQLDEACRACGIYHFIETLPHGFDTVLDDSIAISSGQKQLLTIARAMIQSNPMLILDEATSSVDTRTELITQQAMDRLTEHRTSFVIAHRLSTIKNADLILVLKDGDIIEQGTHKELLAKGGFYADLYNSQFEKAS